MPSELGSQCEATMGVGVSTGAGAAVGSFKGVIWGGLIERKQ